MFYNSVNFLGGVLRKKCIFFRKVVKVKCFDDHNILHLRSFLSLLPEYRRWTWDTLCGTAWAWQLRAWTGNPRTEWGRAANATSLPPWIHQWGCSTLLHLCVTKRQLGSLRNSHKRKFTFFIYIVHTWHYYWSTSADTMTVWIKHGLSSILNLSII